MSQDKHPGRPRQPEVDTRLSEAVLALLRSGGPGAVTVEAEGMFVQLSDGRVMRMLDPS